MLKEGFPEQLLQKQIFQRGIRNLKILEAFRSIDRSLFVPAALKRQAYDDCALPIGYGQTISQPYIVALMTSLLHVEEANRVLEIGTGSGYQTAILAWLKAEIWTIEYVADLQERARNVLEKCGLAEGIHFLVGDGYDGWPSQAPFDHIIVTCAPEHVPPPLLSQLSDPGRMVLPVGRAGLLQHLVLVTKESGVTNYQNISGVAFVPLVRKREKKSQ